MTNIYKYFMAATAITTLCTASLALAQNNYQDWAAAGMPALDPVTADAPQTVLGGLTQFADQASFDAATGGFPVETFDNGATAPGAVNTCTEPVSSASNDVCFSPGDLIDGFMMTSSSGGGVVALGSNFLGANQASTVVGANTFADTTSIAFAPAVTAVAFDAYIGAPGPGDYNVTALDTGGGTIGSITVTTTAVDQGVFAGFTSTVPIATIVLDGVGGSGELLDNLQFGDPNTLPPAPAVPTLNQFGLLLLAGLLLIVGVFAYRRFAA